MKKNTLFSQMLSMALVNGSYLFIFFMFMANNPYAGSLGNHIVVTLLAIHFALGLLDMVEIYRKNKFKKEYLDLIDIEVDNYIGTYERGNRGLCLHYPQQEKELEPLLFNNVITPENNLADHLHYIRTDKGPISLIGMPKKIKRR